MKITSKMINGLNKSQIAILKRAMYADVHKRFNIAIQLYKSILIINDTSPYVFARLGGTYFSIGSYKSAIKYFNKSLALYPEAVHTVFLKAQAEEKIALIDHAISDYTAYLDAVDKTDKKHYENIQYAYISLGTMMYYDKKDYKRAIEYLDRAVNGGTVSGNVFFIRALAKEKLYLLKAACSDYAACLALRPHDAEAWANIGFIYQFRKLYEKAMYCYNKSLQIKKNPHISRRLKKVCIKMKQQKIKKRDR